jgi:Protein of unknown function (DUF4232)/Ricin-type beta-trefoil lectin domain
MLTAHRRRWPPPLRGLALVSAICSALLASACSAHTPSGQPAPARSPTPAAHGTTPSAEPMAAPQPGTAAPPAAPGSPGSPVVTHSRLPRCRTGQLSAVFAGLNAGMGSRGMTLILTNRSARTCSLYGYPGLGFLTSGGFPMPTHVTRVNVAHGRVTLRPGGNAQAQLTWHAGIGSAGAVEYPRMVQITPPDAYGHLTLTWPDEPVQGGDITAWPVSRARPGPALIGGGTVGNPFNGMCMAAAGNGDANGTKVVAWKCDGDSSQQWAGYSDGTLRIHGKCLDVNGRSTEIGATVDLWACDGSASQHWLIGQASQNPFGGIIGAASGNALTDPGGSTVNGTSLEMGPDRGDLSCPWHVSFYDYLRM